MARPVSQAIADRNRAIIEKYKAGKEISELGEAHGLSKVHIRKTLETAGVEIRKSPRKGFIQRRSKSNTLVAMGARLDRDRIRHDLSIAEYGLRIGMSETRVSEAIQGLYDWKLSEIERAAKQLGINLEQFMEPPRLTEPGAAVHGAVGHRT